MRELPTPEAITYFSCYSGLSSLAAFYKNDGPKPKDIASLSMLLSLQKISTGRETFKIPFPVVIFFPILFII